MSLINFVAILNDASGSMQPFRHAVVSQFNQQVEELQANAKETGQATFVSLYSFDSMVNKVRDRVSVDKFEPIGLKDYNPGGMTALFDCIGRAVVDMRSAPGADHPDVSFLLVVLTDGLNNASRSWSHDQIHKTILDLTGSDRWTFAAITPQEYRDQLLNIGFFEGNIKSWNQRAGLEEFKNVGVQTQAATRSYYASRASGVRSTKTFFSDLSSVSSADIAAATHTVNDLYRKYQVEKERTIKDFVEEKTKRPYLKGESFYLLTKKEKIQDHKEIILENRTDGKLHGGDGARQILGLPRFGEVRVHPGNHANYNIFVQSTSVNRILVRGSAVLVRK